MLGELQPVSKAQEPGNADTNRGRTGATQQPTAPRPKAGCAPAAPVLTRRRWGWAVAAVQPGRCCRRRVLVPVDVPLGRPRPCPWQGTGTPLLQEGGGTNVGAWLGPPQPALPPPPGLWGYWGMLVRGDRARGAVHAGVQHGERGCGLLAQQRGRTWCGAEIRGDPQWGQPRPDITCVELRAVDCSHHRVQLPACGQGERVRPGHPPRSAPPTPGWAPRGRSSHPKVAAARTVPGGASPRHRAGTSRSPTCPTVQRVFPAGARRLSVGCLGMPLPSAAPALLALALTVGVGVGSLLVRHDPGRGVVHLRREGTGTQRLWAAGLVRLWSRARSAALSARHCHFGCWREGCRETWDEPLSAAALL